jgi:hypothetical protein
MTTPTIGSLFTGYGGLELALQRTLNIHPTWFVENNKAATKVLTHHWPDVPNLKDATTVDWTHVAPVTVLTGGTPCQRPVLSRTPQGNEGRNPIQPVGGHAPSHRPPTPTPRRVGERPGSTQCPSR